MSTDWFEPIRAYCERAGAGFWDEPLNAATNAAFLVAALAAARRAERDPAALALAALAGIVGIGSFLFHTLAVHWAMLADVIPIALFIYGYFFLALRRFLGLGGLAAGGATLGFLIVSFGLVPALDALTGRDVEALTNGSIAYLPAFLALGGVAAPLVAGQTCHRAAARRAAGLELLGIAALFGLSLAARTLDRAACGTIPVGTHWLWHLFNAGVLYGLITTAIRYRQRVPD